MWSGKRGSNSRPPPWQGGALPTELFPLIFWPKTTTVQRYKNGCNYNLGKVVGTKTPFNILFYCKFFPALLGFCTVQRGYKLSFAAVQNIYNSYNYY